MGSVCKRLAWVSGVAVVILYASVGCFGPGVPAPVVETPGVVAVGGPANGSATSTDPFTPTPIPAADAREPTPINDPANAHPDITTGVMEPGAVSLAPILPGLGWGDTIDLLDLLDLLPQETLADILNPATQNPGSFTTLELLCQDRGISDSICRSRYGSP